MAQLGTNESNNNRTGDRMNKEIENGGYYRVATDYNVRVIHLKLADSADNDVTVTLTVPEATHLAHLLNGLTETIRQTAIERSSYQ